MPTQQPEATIFTSNKLIDYTPGTEQKYTLHCCLLSNRLWAPPSIKPKDYPYKYLRLGEDTRIENTNPIPISIWIKRRINILHFHNNNWNETISQTSTFTPQ